MAEASNAAERSLLPVAGEDSTVDRVTADVRRAVLSGALPPGQTFSTAELSTQLGVSHIPVREALRRLDAQGLVVLRPGRKAMISPLSRDELRAIFRLRQLIEPDLAARSVSLLRPDDLTRAAGLLDDGVVEAMTPQRLATVLAPKAVAAWHLHERPTHRQVAGMLLALAAVVMITV